MKKHFTLLKHRTPKNRKGFALIIALALMAFLVLLVVTLSAIVQIELKANKQAMLDQRAKQAARFAAYQALGEIQKTLGPDQRITANAAILDQSLDAVFDDLESNKNYDWWNSNPNFSRQVAKRIDGIANPLWVGVWNSTPGKHPLWRGPDQSRMDYSDDVMRGAVTFLVSGNNIIRNRSESLKHWPTDDLTDNYINMVRKNSYTDENGSYDTQTMRVKVPIVTIPENPARTTASSYETRIAWWVSDESQKAAADAIASYDEYSDARTGQNLIRLQQMPYNSGLAALTIPNSRVEAFNFRMENRDDRILLKKVSELSQLDLLSDSSSNLGLGKIFFNSITFGTKGLLVNTRAGGLKKDLSVGLLRLNNDPLNPSYFERPYGVEGYDAYFHNRSGEYNQFKKNKLNGAGHMFGPQAADDINLSYKGLNYNKGNSQTYGYVRQHKDPGGPLWDSLRSYYNTRVDQNGTGSNASYDNKVKVKTDTTTGLSPVLQHFQLLVIPALSDYGGGDYGVRIYYVPVVVLWNPYDAKIDANFYAFQIGAADSSFLSSSRVAIGYLKGGNVFQSIRDYRTERITRPIINSSGATSSGGKSLPSYDTANLNRYRYVNRSGVMPKSSPNGIATSDDTAINKAYFGYGPWTWEDTMKQDSEIPNDPKFGGLIRFYQPKTLNFTYTVADSVTGAPVQKTATVSFKVLTKDSFYFRRLYLNDVKTSIARVGQRALSSRGSMSYMTESRATNASVVKDGNGYDVNFRFLVNSSGLQPGQAKIFSLKESVPYNLKFNGKLGYAGNFYRAQKSHPTEWCLTEGISNNKMGGFFIDILHPEKAHANIAGLGSGTATTTTSPAFRTDPWEYDKGYVGADNKPLGALFNINDALGTGNDGFATEAVSLAQIRLDYDAEAMVPQAGSQQIDTFSSPYGYYRYDKYWLGSNNPMKEIPDRGKLGAFNSVLSWDIERTPLLMWDYSDDNNKVNLYRDDDGNDNAPRNAATFQTLKRYLLNQNCWDSTGGNNITSFPFPRMNWAKDTVSWGEHPLWRYGGMGGSAIGAANMLSGANCMFGEGSTGLGYNYLNNGYGIRFESNYVKGFFSQPYLQWLGNNAKSPYDKYLLNKIKAAVPQWQQAFASEYEFYKEFKRQAGLGNISTNGYWFWEDFYFLFTDPRRISPSFWSTAYTTDKDNNSGGRCYDRQPQNFVPFVVAATSTAALPISNFTGQNSDRIVMSVGVSAYRPISTNLDSSVDWQTQYPLKYPYITNTNITGKFYGDPTAARGGSLRDSSYGPRTGNIFTGEGHGRFGRLNNMQYAAVEFGGDGRNAGSRYIYKTINILRNMGEKAQVGPNPTSTNTYDLPMRHFLREKEVVSNMAQLSSADLSYGAEVGRGGFSAWGLGVATGDILYPTYSIGNSFANMRIAPERTYDFWWCDGEKATTASATRNGTFQMESEYRGINYDLSWHLNDVLWDEYFFSTIPYRTDERSTRLDRTYWNPRNPRIKYVDTLGPDIQVPHLRGDVKSTISDSRNLELDFEANAARLWINGPFNVNSTDVDAWKAVLATSFGTDVMSVDSTSPIRVGKKAPFPRNGLPATNKEFTDNSVDNSAKNAMTNFRALDSQELEELALSMVENVKDRGPFYSLADFVNRTVEMRSAEVRRMHQQRVYDLSDDFYAGDALSDASKINVNKDENKESFYVMQNHMQKGVMQSAIDMTIINEAFFDSAYLIELGDSALNSRFAKISRYDDRSANWTLAVCGSFPSASQLGQIWSYMGDPRESWENYRAVLGSTLAGASAYLTQADILQQIGSFITVRGDTFKIRAYGEIRNPITGAIESKAWCEMVVQRYPEYVDSVANAPTDIENRDRELGTQNKTDYDTIYTELSDGNLSNKYLGRRFKVVSFRWLSEREI